MRSGRSAVFTSVKELLAYRGMVGNFIKKEIRGKYKGSILGFLWNFIVPLMQVVTYVLVFSIVFRPDIPSYPVYLIVGMVPWIFFSECLSGGTGTIIANASLVTKIYFPRTILPISVTVSKFVNFVIAMIVAIIIIVVFYDYNLNATSILLVPLLMVMLYFFSLGLTMLLSAINAYYRDVEYIVGVALMILIWLTPILYKRSSIDDPLLSTLLKLNPMTYFTEAFDQVLYEASTPEPYTFIVCAVLTILSLLIGWYAFIRLEKNFAEVM